MRTTVILFKKYYNRPLINLHEWPLWSRFEWAHPEKKIKIIFRSPL